MLNWWENDDFSILNMTEAINTLYVPPGRIGAMNLFKGQGLTTTFVGIEMTNNQLKLIPTAPRGTMPEHKSGTTRNLRAVQVPHLPKNSTIVADNANGIREFGSEDSLVAPVALVNQRLEELKAEHELTWEWHRLGALQGKLLDADGTTTLLDLFDLFSVTRTTKTWATGTVGNIVQHGIDVKRAISDALVGVNYTGIYAFCGEAYWDKITTHAETRDAFATQNENAYAREGAPVGTTFTYQGITYEEYRGSIGGLPLIPTNEAFAFPVGADIYRERWAPGTFMDAVNTIGKPFYSSLEPLKHNIGVEIHTQSNILFYVTRPKALIRLLFS